MPFDPKEIKKEKEQTAAESVDNLIKGNEEKKANEGASALSESMSQVQDSVARVIKEGEEGLVGMEKPSEKISEGVSEKKGDGSSGASGAVQSDDDDAQQIIQNLKKVKEPSQNLMIRRVRKAIEADIKEEFGKLKKLQKNLTNGSAEEFNQSVAKIRSLKEIMNSLFHGTLDFIKGLYSKYFTPEGHRRTSN